MTTGYTEGVEIQIKNLSGQSQSDEQYITPYTFQDSTCKDYLLMEISTFDDNMQFTTESLQYSINEYPSVDDKIRGKSGNYWTHYTNDTGGTSFGYFRKVFNTSALSLMFDLENTALPSFEKIENKNIQNEDSLFFSTKETIALIANENAFTRGDGFEPEMYKSFIHGEAVGKGSQTEFTFPPLYDPKDEYTDHTCFINGFYTPKEINKMAAGESYCYADIDTQYNSYIEQYEKLISKPQIKEWTVPNLYAFYLMKQEGASADFKNLITMLQAPSILKTVNNIPQGQYYTEYALHRNKNLTSLYQPLEKYKNIIIPYSDIKHNMLFNENANLFPMSVNINFKTDSRTKFAEILKQSQLSTTFTKYIVDLLDPPSDQEGEVVNIQEWLEQSLFNVFEYGVDKNRNHIIKKFDLADFIATIKGEDFFNTLNDDNAVFLGMLSEEIRMDNTSDYSMILSLLSAIFQGQVKGLVDKHFRTFQEMLSGRPAYSETVMYKISKYEVNTVPQDGEEVVVTTPIQSIYLPNSNEIDIHEYIDTQVKYGKIYVYKIFGYEMVIGNKYKYQPAGFGGDTALIEVTQEPSIQLLETELFTRTLTVVDDPPVAPEINIVPYKGVNNKILHLLTNSVGKILANPIAIEDGEQDKINSLKILKDKDVDEPILFKSDDVPKFFEVYRITQKPHSYQDFAGNRLTRIRTDIDLKTIQKASSAGFKDAILPNKKYYYMFRSIDVHNNISLPTEVFEVELIDDSGLVYPQIKAIELKKPNKNVPSKILKRWLKIKPATSQLFFNEDSLQGRSRAIDVNKVSLGLAEEKVWGEKFKLRLTSRQTGKKIDINFQFDYKAEPE